MLLEPCMIDAPAPRHAQMKDHRIAAIGVNQPVFRAAAKPRHHCSGQPLPEVLWKGAPEVGAARFDPNDAPTFQHMLKAANGGLDFGKFGHARRDMAKGGQPR